MTPSSPIIVALDYPRAEDALAMAARLDPARVRVKVGKELFTRAGPDVVRALQDQGFEVFLDLKYHDIPNTVAGAVRAAAELGVWMVNVHASGGKRMMSAAREALEGAARRPLLTAVTVLTSQTGDDLREVGIARAAEEQVMALARLTEDSGLDGVVCSALEAPMLRRARGENFLLVTPGIRPEGSASDDQRRIMTPRQAREQGVSYMVIGRPITQAAEPTAVVDEILQSLS
ncbi:Orotidine 5'-phosphate decarboxylase [Alloalcanivorax dieselolei B5]|uniref:Orotidine 5'-phosphate decarboxylase n=1 Tax=Alcanivorax dieselolei (strain DSM 16502 / CGMCC 1.3690 / MCCC 1A00001 / B-5) TaxID=930169 RepID=K0CF26_ALCDB|nr:orotidine-5'-phosphate decarboxylase [Alloalcanivorax dieselolei]AFT71238.1 Orotidine 5'-phosphate decarboxylase [Alloalcanivorax dieselolei B5]GGJ94125.1 orotidine 5'-phosphate decarboxylase [Alloalcanivorax dieselolei]